MADSIPKTRLTDAELNLSIEKARELGLPTRYDSIMLEIHPEDRLDAAMGAQRFLNMSPDAGRPSDALRTVSRDYRQAEATS